MTSHLKARLAEYNSRLEFFGEKGDNEYSLEELLSSEAKKLGKGSLGSTYMAFLECGNVVALKRLKGDYAFGIEVEKLQAFGELVHENLLPVKAYFYTPTEKLFICDYMPTGSLSTLLHGREDTDKTPLSWEIRTKIAYGVACGLEYLHSQGPYVCHGNIRSSNVFVSDFHVVRLSDFGMAQLFPAPSRVKLVPGYCAPEVKYAHEVYQRADIYSFGVLLLELLTRKAPLQALPNDEGIDLSKWVRMMFREKPIIDVFDHELLKYVNVGEQMVQMLELAVCCTFQYPEKRPSISIVSNRIREICGF